MWYKCNLITDFEGSVQYKWMQIISLIIVLIIHWCDKIWLYWRLFNFTSFSLLLLKMGTTQPDAICVAHITLLIGRFWSREKASRSEGNQHMNLKQVGTDGVPPGVLPQNWLTPLWSFRDGQPWTSGLKAPEASRTGWAKRVVSHSFPGFSCPLVSESRRCARSHEQWERPGAPVWAVSRGLPGPRCTPGSPSSWSRRDLICPTTLNSHTHNHIWLNSYQKLINKAEYIIGGLRKFSKGSKASLTFAYHFICHALWTFGIEYTNNKVPLIHYSIIK